METHCGALIGVDHCRAKETNDQGGARLLENQGDATEPEV